MVAPPSAVVEIEFSPGSWTVVSGNLRTFSYSGGRNRERDRPEAGRSTLVMDGWDRSLEPANRVGTYAPNVLLMKRVRVTAQTTDVVDDAFEVGSSYVGDTDVLGYVGSPTVPLFTHFIESLDVDWPGAGFDATVTITAVDAFKVLSLLQPSFGSGGSFYSSGDLVDTFLDACDWPAADRVLDAGTVSVVDVPRTGSALDYLLAIADSEGGLFFQGPDGRLMFYDAAHAAARSYTFATTDRKMVNVDLSYDDTDLFNVVTVATAGFSPDVTVTDARSIGTATDPRYYRRPLSLATMIEQENDRGLRAARVLLSTREPRQRIGRIDLPDKQDAWAAILQASYLDNVTVRFQPPGGGAVVEQLGRIQGIAVSSPSKFDYQVTWTADEFPPTNMLSDDQAYGGGAVGWVAEQAFCTYTLSATQVYVGVTAHKIENDDAGVQDVSILSIPSTGIPAVVGRRYVLSAVFNRVPMGPVSEGARVELVWRDSGGAILSSTAGADVSLDTTLMPSAWVGAWASGVAPSSTAYVTARLVVTDASAVSGGAHADMVFLQEDG